MNKVEVQIQTLVDRETEAWNKQDAETLLSLFHPDMIWPWPQNEFQHDPATWEFPQGRFNKQRWKRDWEKLFRDYRLVHNERRTEKIVVSDQEDGAFAVVDVDTLWQQKTSGELMRWKGRACKGYTKVQDRWLLIFHTGLLRY